MESMDDTEVREGQVLAGKFRIERVLGRGGMGVVVLAMHMHLDERVAIKFLLPEALKNIEAVKRFEREARAAVKIKSEHVARVTDVGVLETGSPYMVMEYLNGVDLGQYLETHGPLPIEETVEYLLQALEAIAEAHSLGIVHRDLKPANLFRIQRADGSPCIKVLDFGISKLTSGDNALTRTSSMMGSPYYMSPEQMTNSKSVDARADVWALGIILHELLTGRVPYQGETIPEICAQVLQEPPPPLSSLRRDAPRALEDVVSKALAKKREDRFADVGAMARALLPFAPTHARHSVDRVSRVLGSIPPSLATAATIQSVTPTASVAPATEGGTLTGASNTKPDWRPPAGRLGGPKIWVALGAGGVLALGLGAWLAFPAGTGTASPAAEPATVLPTPAPPAVSQPAPLPPPSSASPSSASPSSASPSSAFEGAAPQIAPPARAPGVVRPSARPATPSSGKPVASTEQKPAPVEQKQPATTVTTPKPSDLYMDRK